MSSGFRLYKAAVMKNQEYAALDFDILQRILVQAYAEGWRIREVPFTYAPRRHGASHARVFRFGLAYLRTFWTLWKLRNSILAADYDDRAHDSAIWLQRYWQRRRHKHVTDLIAGEGPVLDVGCGSSRIIGALPRGSVAIDILRGSFDTRGSSVARSCRPPGSGCQCATSPFRVCSARKLSSTCQGVTDPR